MLDDIKNTVKKAFGPSSFTYGVLQWVYGAAARKPKVRRVARRSLRMLILKDSRFDESELGMASSCPKKLLDAVVLQFKPKSFLDIGCGLGKSLEYLAPQGIACLGLEGSEAAIEASAVKSSIRLVDLNHPVQLGQTFDMVWSYEVAEHIHPKFVEIYLDTLTGHGNLIVLSAARPGQGGAGHFNEQPLEYWIKKIESRGFLYQREFAGYLHGIKDGFSENMMVFVRQ